MDSISSRPHRSSASSSILKLIAALLSGAICAAIPLTGFYLLWSWCMAQVPLAGEWVGLIKVGITLAMVLTGGAATLGIAILGGLFVASIVANVLD